MLSADLYPWGDFAFRQLDQKFSDQVAFLHLQVLHPVLLQLLLHLPYEDRPDSFRSGKADTDKQEFPTVHVLQVSYHHHRLLLMFQQLMHPCPVPPWLVRITNRNSFPQL